MVTPLNAYFRHILLGLFALLISAQTALADDAPANDHGADERAATTLVQAPFQDVFDALVATILGRGLNIAKILTAQDLWQTGSVASDESPYRQVRSIEFCSARLSHELVRADPRNVVACPFMLSLYELHEAPGTVRISYRLPFVVGEPALRMEIRALLDQISEDATVWWPRGSEGPSRSRY